jgi:hypothetical protein
MEMKMLVMLVIPMRRDGIGMEGSITMEGHGWDIKHKPFIGVMIIDCIA